MKYPCIRNLDCFKKSGCPQKSWDGEKGCPCWIELSVSKKGNPLEKEIRKQCLDMWLFEFQWAMMGLLEGNQQATESFRNGMVQTDDNGQTHPKPDPVIIALLSFLKSIQNKQEIIIQHEIKKAIDNKNASN
jgi:hypothetical protein